MNKLKNLALAALAVAAFSGTASAQTVWGGVLVDGDGAGSCAPTANTGLELYAMKVDSTASNYTDWHYVKGMTNAGGASQSGFSYVITGGNFTVGEAASDRVFFYLTAAGASDTVGDQIALDSSDPSAPNPGATTFQVIGETINDSYPMHAGSGIQFDGMGTPLNIDLGAGVAQDFPAAGAASVDVVFGALIDFQPTLYLPGPDCGFGGGVESQATAGHGGILGYNVYRQVDAGGPPAKASWNDTNWLAFISADDWVLDMGSGLAGGMSPGDLNAEANYGSWQDSDGVAYNGNEHIFFSDTDVGGRGRGPLAAPMVGGAESYWYVIQPVARGDYGDWSDATEIARVALGFDPLMANGGIDINNDGDAEFMSPQSTVGGGLPGLGLTNGGRPLVSAAVLGATNADPMSADGVVSLKGERGGLELSTGLETANIAGYNVYRVTEGDKVRVNGSLIAANGGEGSVYRVSDRLLRRFGGATYEVEVVFNDGTASRTEGPFSIKSAPLRGSSRRGR
ncbi:MAG: hypothetical protein AAF533_06995 [Acidobacteriota bacterium]